VDNPRRKSFAISDLVHIPYPERLALSGGIRASSG
jgi:hypothetical protein